LIEARSHPLVAMTNDHDGRPLFPATWPGEKTVTGVVELGNEGALAYTYRMQAREPMPQDANLEIIRTRDGAVLYSGRLDQAPVDLGKLAAGQSVRLELVLSSADGDLVTPTLVWSARAQPPALHLDLVLWPLIALLALLDAALAVGWVRELLSARRLELLDRMW
jgi:hypothetical protein